MTNAAKEMNLRPSTARAIIKTYEATGKVFETRKEQERRELLEKIRA